MRAAAAKDISSANSQHRQQSAPLKFMTSDYLTHVVPETAYGPLSDHWQDVALYFRNCFATMRLGRMLAKLNIFVRTNHFA